MFLTQLLYKWRNLPKMTSRQPWKKMMFNLKLQPTMKPIHEFRTSDVKCPIGLLLEPIVSTWFTNINARRKMVQSELNMLNPSDRKARQHKHNALAPIRQARNQQRVPYPKH
ncbi:hypothetical protein HanRHA438_Chr07g0296221 [Helianthus annuus]|nr:hypothetical protein HanIR_Chr00c20g0910001 [Helianthus annuus]KAJ0907207.1 hypothetical protein HanRHA438_Chr07g0296221 [Helianthus annuus]